jgi:hypothetical protein
MQATISGAIFHWLTTAATFASSANVDLLRKQLTASACNRGAVNAEQFRYSLILCMAI